jgi:hypothetical protein
MIYVKSLFAGLGALITYVFLFVTFGVRLFLPTPSVPQER